ncbi:MAG: squalene/phytoene synthase family protein [Deltaproteobacteria bacterium]|nr:squalene/phytoene synthase family protein [Deltaproteobacteria bacterium]
MTNPSSMPEDSFWHKLAKRSQSNLYFALMFLPAERREAFRDVYRFLRAADDEADAGYPPEEAHVRLCAWRRELAAVYAGQASHPIAARLVTAVRRFRLTRAHFETILDALEQDIEPRRFPSYPELERWCAQVSGTLGELCLEILDVRSAGATAYAKDMGVALQLANIVRDVAEDATRGRVYLPCDELAREGVAEEDILARRYSPAFARVAASQAERVRLLVERARGRLTEDERRRLLVPEIWADVYLALLLELEHAGFDVMDHRPYLKRRKKLAIAVTRWWKESRSGKVLFPARKWRAKVLPP